MRAVALFAALILTFPAFADGVYTRTRVTNPLAATTSIASGTAIPAGGTPTNIQYNLAGNLAGISGSSVDTAGNVTLSGTLSATTFLGNAADTASAPAYSWGGDTNTGIYNSATGAIGFAIVGNTNALFTQTRNNFIQPVFIGNNSSTPSATLHVSGTARITSWTAIAANVTPSVALDVYGTVSTTVLNTSQIIGGSTLNVSATSAINNIIGTTFVTHLTGMGLAIGTNNVNPSATLHVSGSLIVSNSPGTISVSTYVNVGSPTTPPACNATNKGNVFMNTTTNCLQYCDGTANRQVTSVAGGCT